MATSYNPIKLKLKICKANGLAKKDIFGASDPYVVIHLVELLAPGAPAPRMLHEENKIGQTYIKTRTLNPVWNETFEFNVCPASQSVVVDVFDWNRWTRDDFLGRVMLRDLSSLELGGGLIRNQLEPRSWENVTDTFRIPYGYVSGTIDFELSSSSHLGDDEDGQVFSDSVFTRYLKIVDRFHLNPVLHNLVTGASLENLKVEVSEDPEQDIVFAQNKLVLPKNVEELEKKILKFLFIDDQIIPGNAQQIWLIFIRNLKRQDPHFYRFLKIKLRVATAEGLNNILMKFTKNERVRFVPEYKVLLIPRQNETNNEWKGTLKIWALASTTLLYFGEAHSENQIEEAGLWIDEDTEEETDNPNGHDSILNVQRSHLRQDGPVLPSGWEWRRDLNGRTLYYDHNNRSVTFQRPDQRLAEMSQRLRQPVSQQQTRQTETAQRPSIDQQSFQQQDRLSETAQRFAEMFLEDNNASGRFDVRNYGARRMMSSVDDTEEFNVCGKTCTQNVCC